MKNAPGSVGERMLTKEHAIAVYDRTRIIPDCLTPKNHPKYPDFAQQMVEIYQSGIGRSRRDLHQEVRMLFANEPDCPPRRIDAFCKLLDDASVYSCDIPGKAAKLRREVFRLASTFHPLVVRKDRFFENCEREVKNKIAAQLGKSWDHIELNLFADVIDNHKLTRFKGFENSRELLTRYNVGQLQVALFNAAEMVVQATDDLKTIIRYAKLARLMHTIEQLSDGVYRIRFNGPASVLRQTRRYGVSMAKFLPSLLSCRNWSMKARLETRRKGFYVNLELSHYDRFKSYLPAREEFDSKVEENFAEKWGDETRSGWRLLRESEMIWKDQRVFFPDFVLQHDDGRKVLLEIVGFWTPEYIQEKAKTLKIFHDYHILLAAAETVAERIPKLHIPVITYKSTLLLKDVLSYLEIYKSL
jgi:predicted nuclease of restriction endonuclease-like RecB superfamily